MWNLHVDDSQGTHRYNMILGRDIFYEINTSLCFSNNIISGNGGVYKVCTAPVKYVSIINFNCSSVWIKGVRFCNK